MNRTTLIFLIALFLTPSSFILSAPPQSRDQSPPSKYKELIKKFDKDGDGRLDERERSSLRNAIVERRVQVYGKRTPACSCRRGMHQSGPQKTCSCGCPCCGERTRHKDVDPFTRRHDPYAPHRRPRYYSPRDSHPRHSPHRRDRQ